MRIFPNTAGITVTQEANMETDIPLAYIDTNSIEHIIETVVLNNFKTESKNELMPYQRIATDKITLFDKEGKQIPYDEIRKSLIRDKGEYIYIPKDSRRFSPKTFSYNIIARKHSKYRANMPYNIKALAYSCKAYANNLISIFADSNTKGEAPSNVVINGGDLSMNSLLNNTISEVDVTFLRMKTSEIIIEDDFMNPGETVEMPFNKNMFLDDFRANMIGFFDSSSITDGTEGIDEEKVLLYKMEEKEVKLKSNIFYKDVLIKTDKFFNIPTSKEGIVYHNIFDNSNMAPLLIEEHIGKGFFIYMTDEFAENTKKYSKIIYEALGFVYFNRYLKSGVFTEWIADKVPDYVVKDMKLSRKLKFLSAHSLDRIFGFNSDELTVQDVVIDKKKYPFVEFLGIEDDYLEFRKTDNEKWRDPIEKKPGEISIYSYPDIFFYKDFVYSINNDFTNCIKAIKNENRIEIFYDDFKHSKNSIYVQKSNKPLVIELIRRSRSNEEEHTLNADYNIICKPQSGISTLSVIDKRLEVPAGYLELATIKIRQKNDKTTMVDMRQRGGGLPVAFEDNFNCLDIGHVHGRPYRKGGAVIFTLPKKLELYKDRIERVIKEHCLAEDYPIILFEEER